MYNQTIKPDNKITFINVQPNHPPNIIKQLPKTIEQGLSNNSSNGTIVDKATPLHEKALSKQENKTKKSEKGT